MTDDGSNPPAATGVDLHVGFAGRGVTLAWLLTAMVCWALAGTILAVGLYATLVAVDPAERGATLAVVVVGTGVAALLAGGVTRTANRRSSQPAPSLTFGGEWLRLEAPTVLEEPWVVQTREVRAVCIDDRNPPLRRQMEGIRRFPVGAALGWRPTWLYSTWGPPRLPKVGYGHEVPNLVILFRRQLPLPATRRPHLVWRLIDLAGRLRPQRLPDTSRGVLVQVADPAEARAVSASTGLLGAVEELDPVALGLAEPDRLEPMACSDDPGLAPEEVDSVPVGTQTARWILVGSLAVATVVVVLLRLQDWVGR